MCGRFAQFSPDRIDEYFEIEDDAAPDLPFNYNVAPTQIIRAVVKEDKRKVIPIHWGLVTIWSQEKNYSLINVRDDTLRDKETFHKNFENNRCIIPADGFYEWKKDTSPKQPFFIHFKTGEPLAFAGLYNILEGKDNRKKPGEEVKSAAIITTEANPLMNAIHDRMPVILPKSRWEEWLDNTRFDHDRLLSYLEPYKAVGDMEAYIVSTAVNSSKHNKPEYIVRTGEIIHA